MCTILMGIDYDEGDQSTYRGVTLQGMEGKLKARFESGDPTKDYALAGIFGNMLVDEQIVQIIVCQSSCRHFVLDGDRYEYNHKNLLVRVYQNEQGQPTTPNAN